MNPYIIMGVIAICASLFAGVVALLAGQGVPILAAFICVYVVAIWFMLSLQRRAREAAEGSNFSQQQVTDREYKHLPETKSSAILGMANRQSEQGFGS